MTPKTKTPNKKLEKLETTNIKILEFYENTNLDFESMNLLIIDIYNMFHVVLIPDQLFILEYLELMFQ